MDLRGRQRGLRDPYTEDEYARMVVVYIENGNRGADAARAYALRWPGVRVPDRRTFDAAYRRYVENHRLIPLRVNAGRNRVAHFDDVEDRIIDIVEEEPTTSVRSIAREVNASKSLVNAVIREAGKHPYHYRRVQELLDRDGQPRVNFCSGLLAQVRRDPTFLDKILWTDESTFTRVGVFNQRNYHYYADRNPHLARPSKFQYQWSINVWAGMFGRHILGPVYLPPRLNGELYLAFLQQHLPPLIGDLPIEINRQGIIYQHDGAPPHYARRVTEYLNLVYPDMWIGRNGPILWPPRSPDLTPLDFFLWGHVKELVYKTPVTTEDECRRRIDAAFAKIIEDPEMILRATRALVRRSELVLENNGQHFEQLL